MKTSNKFVDVFKLSLEASVKLTAGDPLAGKILAVIVAMWNVRMHKSSHPFSPQTSWVVIKRKEWMQDLCLTADELDQTLAKLLKSRLLKRVEVGSSFTIVQPSQQAVDYLAPMMELHFV